ncbi:MAG TPA: hypothetical protein PK005_09460, partial [Bacteroidales bacterium]|nr:hypothetical protein [Bacteroidales bacterium]
TCKRLPLLRQSVRHSLRQNVTMYRKRHLSRRRERTETLIRTNLHTLTGVKPYPPPGYDKVNRHVSLK